jgi:hypothetical protein
METPEYWTMRSSFVGVSLLAIAVCQAKDFPLENRFREQARSHRDLISIESIKKVAAASTVATFLNGVITGRKRQSRSTCLALACTCRWRGFR